MEPMKKRNLFEERSEALGKVQQHREGKITLRRDEVKEQAKREVTPEMIRETRERLKSLAA
jgi:hypothetical protein